MAGSVTTSKTSEHDPETLARWTTASLVLAIARFAVDRNAHRDPILTKNAQLVAAELNARIPPRVTP